jgi:hypothetical protein
MDTYNPATIGSDDMIAILARLDRYLNRHGSRYGEAPIRDDQRDDVRQSILADWLGDDWTARDMESLARHGRTLFPPTLSETGRHLRGLLFHAGRARKRGWRAEGSTRRVADRRRDREEFTGAGSASRAADPARIVAAVESATGALVLSPAAQRERSRRGLPATIPGGASFVSSKAPRPFRVMRRRGRKGITIDVVARLEDRTLIDVRPYTVHRFERVGSVPNRDVPRSFAKLPAGVTAADCREAIG